MRTLLATIFCSLIAFTALSQCTECTPDETCNTEEAFPLICPELLPAATAGEYYESFMTFYLPANVVDPESQLEAELLQVVVNGASGLPFGLTYQTNSENNTYFPSQGDTYGCATVCGTPLVPGEYEVLISVTVTVSAFGFEQVLDQSFPLPLVVLPGESTNTSFTSDNLFGCGEAEVQFSALIDGSPGITSYTWDFGNGSIGNVQNPPAQGYDSPGDYTVTLETTIENHVLNTVNLNEIASGWAGDVEELSELLFNPDPYFVITDGQGSTVYTSDSQENVNEAVWTSIGFELTNPPYSIAIYDADNGGLFGSEDDFLGSTVFDLSTGNQSYSAGNSLGTLNIALEVTNVFNDEEVVSVFPFPDTEFTFLESENVLDYNDPLLNYFVWTYFGDTVQVGLQDSLFLSEPGIYQCTVTNVFGCEATSEAFTLCPELELIHQPLIDQIMAPEGFETYTWFFNGLPVAGEIGNTIDASEPGNYALTITTDYGCSVTSDTLVLPVGLQEASAFVFSSFPNPAHSHFQVESPSYPVELEIVDLSGKTVLQQTLRTLSGRVNISSLPVGTYLVQFRTSGATGTQKLLIAR